MNHAETGTEERQDMSKRRGRQMLYAAIAGVCVAFLFFSIFKDKLTKPACASSEPQKGDIVFDKAGRQVDAPPRSYSEQELLSLARAAKDAGLVVQGVSQCGYTRKQRELFGAGEARKVFESMYIECRSQEMCPGVRGFPTWSRGSLQFPGFRGVDRIRELIKEVGPLPAQQPPEAPAEPSDQNIPGAEDPAPPLPQAARARDVSRARVEIVEEEEEEEPKTENVRGVSQFAPLNVPDMPGTAPMTTGDLGMAMYQYIQGNVPRQALDNPDAVAAIAAQMAATFSQIAHDASRDPADEAFANARLPQSANISTGDALADNRIYAEKN